MMLCEHLPLIVIEVVFVFGGALAFAWWQLRDLAREKRRREERERGHEPEVAGPASAPAPAAQTAPVEGHGDDRIAPQ
jgi:hypothetical protein